jgi:uncharacterized protein (DUF885 family)
VDSFDDLIDSFLADHYAEAPIAASFAGLDGHDDESTDLSAAGFARRDAAEDRWLEQFSSLPDDQLSADERIDRDLVLSDLRGKRAMRDWQVWRRNPDTYLSGGLMGVFSLFVRSLHPEEHLAAAAAARLRAVPDALQAGRDNLDAELVSPVLAGRALGQCRAAVRYCRELVPAEAEDEANRTVLASAGAVAAEAYDDFASFLAQLALDAGGTHAIGEARYDALLQEKELLGYGAAELRRRGQAAYDELDAEMRALALEVDAASDGDWRAVMEQLNDNHPDSPDAMRDGYEDWTERARQFLHEHELVTFPEGEQCLVVPSPMFQRPTLAVASYFAPPAFRPSVVGRFNVPYPPDGTPPEEVAARLRTNGFHSMPTISVHEAYPGHHWHFVTLFTHARPIRRVLSSSYFTEGWGLYAERMMHEQGFFADPRDALCHLDARIFRAARIVVDTSLHLGDMTFDEAVAFMQTNASLSEPTAKAEVARYCAWPTQAASYLTGSLEIERMRRDYLDGGHGDLRTFHDTVAASGALPIALAERALRGD